MSVLDDMITTLTTIKDSLPDIAEQVLVESAAQIEDKVIEQLQRGERGDGSILPNYSERSVKQFGKPFGPIKLFDQGDFYQGIKFRNDGIGDDDWKTPMLTEHYGNSILDLQDQSLDELKEDVILPALLDKVNNLLAA